MQLEIRVLFVYFLLLNDVLYEYIPYFKEYMLFLDIFSGFLWILQ